MTKLYFSVYCTQTFVEKEGPLRNQSTSPEMAYLGEIKMTKQTKAKTLKDKKAAGVATPAKKTVKVQVAKGPTPDFTQNKARAEAAHQNNLAVIKKARQAESDAKELKLRQLWEAKQVELHDSYTKFVAGTPGDNYFIGAGEFRFVVYQRAFSAKGNLPAQMVTVIEEYRALHGTKHPVYFPHEFLFRNVKKVVFVGGITGEIQEKMFIFLKGALAKEIAIEKAFRENPVPKANPAVASMAKVDQEHSVALGDEGPANDGIASMQQFNREHELLETT